MISYLQSCAAKPGQSDLHCSHRTPSSTSLIMAPWKRAKKKFNYSGTNHNYVSKIIIACQQHRRHWKKFSTMSLWFKLIIYVFNCIIPAIFAYLFLGDLGKHIKYFEYDANHDCSVL